MKCARISVEKCIMFCNLHETNLSDREKEYEFLQPLSSSYIIVLIFHILLDNLHKLAKIILLLVFYFTNYLSKIKTNSIWQ